MLMYDQRQPDIYVLCYKVSRVDAGSSYMLYL